MQKFILIFILFIPQLYGYVFNFGYRVNQADTDLRVYHHYYDDKAIEEYILRHMAGADSSKEKVERAREISVLIKKVSQHFKIDPLVYLGLIRMESAFYYTNNLSNSGAVGLTQFVQIGLKEVFSQLGFLSDSNATETSLNFFRSAYEATRLEIKEDFSLIPFRELKRNLKSYNLSRGSDLRKFKSLFKGDTPIQVIFGAVFMKTLVGRQCDKYGSDYCRNKSAYKSSSFKAKLLKFYRNALVGYNGEKTPVSYCSHEGRVLAIEQNYMRFCYAAKISDWAKQLDSSMQELFGKYERKLNHIYINKIVDQFFFLNKLVDKKLYHNRIYQDLPSFEVRDLDSDERCHSLDLKLRYTVNQTEVDPLQQIYTQERSYYVPHCRVSSEGSFLELKKVVLLLEFSLAEGHFKLLRFKNPTRGFRYRSEPQSSLERHFLPRISDFLEQDVFLKDEHITTMSSSIKAKDISGDKVSLEVGLEGLNPKSFHYRYYRAKFEYDRETRKFLKFESSLTPEFGAAN